MKKYTAKFQTKDGGFYWDEVRAWSFGWALFLFWKRNSAMMTTIEMIN